MSKQVTGKIGIYETTVTFTGEREWQSPDGRVRRIYMDTTSTGGHSLGCSIYKVVAGNPSAGDHHIETESHGDLYVRGLNGLSGAKRAAVIEIIEELFA